MSKKPKLLEIGPMICLDVLEDGKLSPFWSLCSNEEPMLCDRELRRYYRIDRRRPIWLLVSDAPVRGAIRAETAWRSKLEFICKIREQEHDLHYALEIALRRAFGDKAVLWWWIEVER